jgi:hypothetical protein
MPTVWRHTQIKSGLILAHVDIYIYTYRTCVCYIHIEHVYAYYIYYIPTKNHEKSTSSWWFSKHRKSPYFQATKEDLKPWMLVSELRRLHPGRHRLLRHSARLSGRVVTRADYRDGSVRRKRLAARGESHSRAVDYVRFWYIRIYIHTHLCVYLYILQYVCRILDIIIYIYIYFMCIRACICICDEFYTLYMWVASTLDPRPRLGPLVQSTLL